MASKELEYPTRLTIEEDESPSNAFISRNRCFHFPCFHSSPPAARLGGSSSSTPSLWDRIRTADSDKRWWARPIHAFKKIREWSEIVAGPKWKTFIRRFNRRHRHRHHAAAAATYQYDPLSYALNFDEGQNGQFDDDNGHFPDFSSRFAAVPLSAKSSMDLGNCGAAVG